jgi:K+-transporting ATPase ATPase C chain
MLANSPLSHLRPALGLVVLSTVVLGLAFPLGFVGVGNVVLPNAANGSVVTVGGHPVGSSLIGQNFTSPRYFHSRPSAITGTDPKDASKTVPTPYDASTSLASNLAPTSKALIDRVKGDLPGAGGRDAPGDSVTTSGSGLDPDISPENAQRQVAAVAAARKLPADQVAQLVEAQTHAPFLGLFGAPRVNVLSLNLALDQLH